MKSKRRLFDPDGMLALLLSLVANAVSRTVPIYEDYGSFEIPKASVITLTGHTGIITSCGWNLSSDHLASSSADGTVRLWSSSDLKLSNGVPPSDRHQHEPALQENGIENNHTPSTILMNHISNEGSSEMKAIISMSWSPDSRQIAAGTIGGDVLLWDINSSKPSAHVSQSAGPITSVKFNSSGSNLLCCCANGTSVIYSKNLARTTREYQLHDGIIVDCDWKDDFIFATCGRDNVVHVCDVREDAAIRSFAGHLAEINAIQWDPSRQVLASASDDKSLKVSSLFLMFFLLRCFHRKGLGFGIRASCLRFQRS
jgi:transducin (beta)-like 1